MKRIFTRIATFCLLLTTQHLFAQSVTVNTSPNPSVSYNTNVSALAENGFSSNQGTLG